MHIKISLLKEVITQHLKANIIIKHIEQIVLEVVIRELIIAI
jgi:hypothetical protein